MARYIDADKLPIKVWNGDFVGVSKNDIEQTPTEDVAPIVLGKWNDWYFENGYTDAFHCQVCQHLFTVTQGRENMNFCPNCGAKMEELGEE